MTMVRLASRLRLARNGLSLLVLWTSFLLLACQSGSEQKKNDSSQGGAQPPLKFSVNGVEYSRALKSAAADSANQAADSAKLDSANQAADSAKLGSANQAADTLDLLTLSTEFNAQIVVHNYKDFDSLAVDGVALKDSMASVPVSRIAKDAFLTLSWKRGGSRGSLLLRTLHKLVPNMTVTQDLLKGPMSAGDFYLSYVYLRLIQKIGNNGQYLFYRFEPKVDTSGNCTGWWDFKKHHGDDGKIYYSYHEPDSTYASWRFNGFNPGKRVLLDETYNKLKEIQLEAADSIQEGYPVDGHDFYLFNSEHYILMSYIDRVVNVKDRDTVASAYIQEVDSGKVVFDWWSVDHDTLFSMLDPAFDTTAGKDYVHMNSIDVLPDSNLLCSFRHISSVLKIQRDSAGKILWRLDGTSSSNAFHGQHFARYHQEDSSITLFNNDNGPNNTQLLRFNMGDMDNGSVKNKTVLRNDGYFAQACGALTFSGKNVIAGWGIPGDTTSFRRLVAEYNSTGGLIFSLERDSVKVSEEKIFGATAFMATYRATKYE